MKKALQALKLFFKIFFLAVLIYAIYNHKLVAYGWAQLKGQVHILYHAEPIEKVLADKNFPDSLKAKLKIVNDIRNFAKDSLGLNTSKNYTKIFDQKGKPVLWVVTGCAPFAMKAYEWEFPFLGAVSYKGFFVEEKGFPEIEKLKRLGYDTEYHPTGAWSTLGWFNDPILSNMLRRSEGQLAELIIHELTHATLYLPGSVDYNENFATFVGEQGAIHYLKSKYGLNGEAYTKYLHYQEDEKIYGEYMIQSVKKLDQVYKNFGTHLTVKEKLRLKYRTVARIMKGIDQLKLHRPQVYSFDFRKEELPNNTFFMGFYRYRKQQNEFALIPIKSAKDLKHFVLKHIQGSKD